MLGDRQFGADGIEHRLRKMVLVFQRVAVQEGHVLQMRDDLTRQRKNAVIDLDRNHGPCARGQSRRQSARPRADFEHDVVAVELGLLQNELDEVQVDQKILPEVCARMKPVLLKQAHEHRSRLAFGGFHAFVEQFGESIFSTYFARISVSTLTWSCSRRAPSVVADKV